jgi:sugar lactone lactonase YvrE
VTGGSWGSSGYEYATVKYDSGGTQRWVARYHAPENTFSAPSAIAVDSSGYIYVTGVSSGSGPGSDYATIKYNAAGQQIWVARYNHSGGDSADGANAMAVDTSGNVYVTGGSSGGYGTVKYNSAGQQQWVASYNHPGYATAIAVDSSGNVYVTGGTRGFGQGEDYATVKYNSAGQEQWVARYDGPRPGYSTDQAAAIAVDGSGYVYVTGYSVGSGTDVDYATIKYVQEAAPTPTPTSTPIAWPSTTPRPLPTYPPRPTRPPRPTP